MSACVVSDYSALTFMSPFAESLVAAFSGVSLRKAETTVINKEEESEAREEVPMQESTMTEDKCSSAKHRLQSKQNEEREEGNGGMHDSHADCPKDVERIAYCKRISAILRDTENWLFLDTESTGWRNARIIEVGVVETDIEGRITGGTHFRCNPHGHSSRSAKRIHGISDRELEHCYEFAHYAEELRDYLKGRVVIIHNAASDLEWLNAEFHRIDPMLPPIETLCTVVDSFEVARMIPSERTRNGMDGLIEWYGFERLGRYHGGYDDAQMLAKVFYELWLDMQEFLEYEDEA